MNELVALVRTEAKLLFREPITWLAAIALPTAVLLIFGTMFASAPPDPGATPSAPPPPSRPSRTPPARASP